MGCTLTKTEVKEESVMPKAKNIDFKARLEHKLYLAREDPRPVFDLSECDLKHVPHGIYSLCKVFRKDALLLQNNKLTNLNDGGNLADLSMLQVLDIHNNLFSSITYDIYMLGSLRELHINNNQIKRLPESICELSYLEILDVSNNKLKSLPDSMGDMTKLRRLDVSGNPSLDKLPTALCECLQLVELKLDPECFVFPPQSIVAEGCLPVMKFLAEQQGVSYKTPTIKRHSIQETNSNVIANEWRKSDGVLEFKLAQLEKLKEQRHSERLALEKYNEEIQKQELEMHDALKNSKQKLLEDLIDQQSKLETEVMKLQQEKDIDRAKLIKHLLKAESKADAIISQLLILRGNPDYIQQLLEQEKLEEERLLSIMHSEYQSLRKRDVLVAMQGLLEEEYARNEKLREYEECKAATTQNVLQQEIETDFTLSEILRAQGLTQSAIVSRLHGDEQLQRAAVGALLERADARSWGLVQQVLIVEKQLAEITAIEMERKKLHVNEQLNDLADARISLSTLLLDLLSQQGQRRSQLLNTLKQLERDQKTSVDFWILQYQRLMDSRPQNIAVVDTTLDPLLANYLLQEGVIHCLPFLASFIHSDANLAQLTDNELLEAGVTFSANREAILRAIKFYSEEMQQTQTKLAEPSSSVCVPTAPPALVLEEAAGDVGANINAVECVVCMDSECQVIFVPCGHMCCCAVCAAEAIMESCPMCRGQIERKIRVILP